MISCLVAVDKNYGIGFQNSIPWPYLKNDMEWFKQTTMNNIVIMGSNTWRSLKKKLPGRTNVVISKNQITGADFVFDDPIKAIKELSILYPLKNIYIIGGQKLYDSTKTIIDIFYITEIEEIYTCDKFFDFNYVKNNCKLHKEISAFDKTDKTPSYKIREYNNESSRTSIS